MNLNYDPTQEALIELLASAKEELPSHYIAVDFDGEVVIDPELHYPDVAISRYQFATQIRSASLRSARKLEELHNTLMNVLLGHFGAREDDMRIAA